MEGWFRLAIWLYIIIIQYRPNEELWSNNIIIVCRADYIEIGI